MTRDLIDRLLHGNHSYVTRLALAVLVALFAAGTFVIWFTGEWECQNKIDNNTEFVDGDYRLLGGCFVELRDGTRLNYDRYRFEDNR